MLDTLVLKWYNIIKDKMILIRKRDKKMLKLQKISTSQILDIWEEIYKKKTTLEIAETRGMILNELEKRNPVAMDKYFQDCYTDEQLRSFFNEEMKEDLQKKIEELLNSHDDKFLYQLLSRMKQDCDYFLGYGNRLDKHLWATNPTEQIEYMKAIHNNFEEDKKPEWLTMNEIVQYEKEMTSEAAIQ